jgi:hypothetical protein
MPATTSVDSVSQRTEFLAQLKMYMKSSRFADVALHCEDDCIFSHRVILAAGSGYFERVFTTTEKVTPAAGITNVILKDVRADVMKMAIDFIYSGQLNVPPDRMEAFVTLAKTLKLRGLDFASTAKASVPSLPNNATKHNILLPPEVSRPKSRQNVFASPANRMGGPVTASGSHPTAMSQQTHVVNQPVTDAHHAQETPTEKTADRKVQGCVQGSPSDGEKVTRIVPITILEDDTETSLDNVSGSWIFICLGEMAFTAITGQLMFPFWLERPGFSRPSVEPEENASRRQCAI